MASFDENGKYIKTNWKAGDKITATKLNKIEESIEAVNDNDISRHVEADARLDALEAKDVAHDKEFTNVKNLIADNKAAAELGDYEINSRMTFLEDELEEAVAEVNNVASTVDDKIATAEANMTAQVNQGKADMEAMVAEVEADLEGLHAKDEELSEQLAHIEKINNIINRKFKTIVGASPMYYTSESTPREKSYIDMDCARLSKLNIDTAQFVAHIKINNGELEVLESLENFSYSLNKFKEYGIKMNAVKLHFAYDPIDIENYGRTKWLLDYKNLITQFADIAKNEIEYFVVMNERSSIFYNSDYKEDIKEILNYARNYGYKVGVSFTNNEADQLFANDNKWLVNEVDVLFFNSYRAISNKLDKTTKQDSVVAWNKGFNTIKMAKSKTDKPIIISETGVKNYWQYLSNPASWSLGDDTTENSSNGMCSFIYFYGMFNSDIGDYVDEIWLWYPYTYHYDHNYKLFTEYLGGSYNE